MQNEIIATEHAPKAIGPYAQAIRSGHFLFVSGQIPIDPKTGKLVDGIAAQTKQVLNNIKSILATLHIGFESVVKMDVFLIDLAHFQTMNQIYGELLNPFTPARVTVQVSRLPMDSLIEISCIASSEKTR